jgi:hypothetical protein
MAILAPMMMELGEIFMKIILQNAATQVKTMQAVLAQAEQSKDLTIASGEARAKQLEQDRVAHLAKMTSAIVNAVFAGVSAGLTFLATYKAKAAGDAAVETANQERTAAGKPKLTEGEEFTTRTNAEHQAFQKFHGYIQSVSTIVQSSTSAFSESVEAGVAGEKAKLERAATQAQALASMLDKLISTLQSGEQKASEEGKAAAQYWQGLLELMKSFAQLSSQFGSRS